MNACVVYKTPKLEVLLRQDPASVAQLEGRDPVAHRELVAGAAAQQQSNDLVAAALEAAGIQATWLSRDHFEEVPEGTDLVVVVGGDGTVLDVSHRVLDLPVLAFNSDPLRSIGYYTAASAAQAAGTVQALLEGRLDVCLVARLALTVDGVRFPYPCLNDILVANENPCMMSRYVLTAGQRSEKQASSGVWISTPAGSTAGIRSAGGTVMPLEGALIQYLVREPYVPRGVRYELLRGVRHLREGLRIRSLMQDGRLYVDGPWMTIPFGLGSSLELSEGPPLRILGMDPAVRER
jgi:NAD kinase